MEKRGDDGSDYVEITEEATARAADAPPAENLEPPADPVAQVHRELHAARSEAERWHDRFLRKAAELENYRKRADKVKNDTVSHAKGAVILEILPVVDACERALESFDEAWDPQQGLEQYKQGVELLHKQFINILSRLGVVPIEVNGQQFDPHLHEALTRIESPDHEENTVISELRRGYMYQDRLLRPAQVVVATRPRRENGVAQ